MRISLPQRSHARMGKRYTLLVGEEHGRLV